MNAHKRGDLCGLQVEGRLARVKEKDARSRGGGLRLRGEEMFVWTQTLAGGWRDWRRFIWLAGGRNTCKGEIVLSTCGRSRKKKTLAAEGWVNLQLPINELN